MSNLSISQINKVGRKIRVALRENELPDEGVIAKLQEYRINHQYALNLTFSSLVKKSRSRDSGCVVVYRLKRLDTIIRKIERYPSMSLSKMQDIGGCRSIVHNIDQIRKIVHDFEDDPNFNVIDRSDYLETPRDTGYSSYHLVVRNVFSDRCIEIQIRTQKQHHWATLVEITDLLYDVKLKEGEDHPDLYMFHKLLANSSELLSKKEADKLVFIDKKHQILTRLIFLFKGNYFTSMKNWLRSNPKEKDAYVIMILNEELEPEFKFYELFDEAESEYFQLFTSQEPNMVLIHITKPDFEKVGLAYSNYVLSSHPSIRYYLELFRNFILEEFHSKENSELDGYLEYYEEIVTLIKTSFKQELLVIKELVADPNSLTIMNNEVLGNWIDNMEARLAFIENKDFEFKQQLDATIATAKVLDNEKTGVWAKFLDWINDR